MKILVTGGCGFLGSNIAASYLKQGAEVIVFDALFRNGGESNLNWLQSIALDSSQFTHHRIDLADNNSVDSLFKYHSPFDYVCHLGGQVAMTTSISNPRRDMLTNVVGTFNVLEGMRKYSPDGLLAYSSTNKVYGDLEHLHYGESDFRYTLPDYPHGFDESLRLDFASPYGCSKGAADQYVRDWQRNYGIRTVVFRHSSIYGGRQFSTFDQGWIGWFCRQALEQAEARARGNNIAPFSIAGTGKQVRDVLHAEDLISLYQAAYNSREEARGEIFNIGGGIHNSLSLLELFHILQDLLKLEKPLEFEHIQRRQSDQNFFVADVQKAKRVLGWQPQVSSLQGISRMIDWEREQMQYAESQLLP